MPVTVNNHLSSFLNRIVDMTTKILDLRHKDNESSEMDDNENKIAESEDEEDEADEQAAAKPLDDDEDRRNPQYIPKRGGFYEHDDRTREEGEEGTP